MSNSSVLWWEGETPRAQTEAVLHRLKGQGTWMPAEIWQYNSAMEVARFFHMRIDFAGVVPPNSCSDPP